MTVTPRWDIVTGEYPPAPGGVSDYSRLVAEGLAARGCAVHVWTDSAPGLAQEVLGNPAVHRVDRPWSRRGVAEIDWRLGAPGRSRRLLVQYSPYLWGRRGINFRVGRWLAWRGRRGDHVRLMFHELFYYRRPGDPWARRLLPVAHRMMLRTILSGATRVDYATEEWGRVLARDFSAGRLPMAWLPVPSNIPVVNDPEGVAALRRRIAPDGRTVVGTFGTYGDDLRGRLLPVFPALVLARPDRVGLLIGRNGGRFAAEAVAACPELEGRLVVTGALSPEDVSRHLQACDVLVQPYPDGICGRRGTAMACLAHGLAVATNVGPFTERVIAESDAAVFAFGHEPDQLIAAAERLLADPKARTRLGVSASQLYHRHFALERTLDALLS